MRKLQLTTGPEGAQALEMEIDRDLVIGREGADVVIPDEEISRRHAILRPVERGVEVEDLGSTNGTYVDGNRISVPVIIAIRGAIDIGTSRITIDVSLSSDTKPGGTFDTNTRVTPPSLGVTTHGKLPDALAPPGTPGRAPVVIPGAGAGAPQPVMGSGTPLAMPPPAPAAVTPPPPPAAAIPRSAPVPSGSARRESPQLPLPASLAIYIAALIAIATLVVMFD